MRSLRSRAHASALPAVLITPLIDVIMCLLIVFMVIQPGLRRGLDVQVPGEESGATEEGPSDLMVLYVMPNGRYAINQIPVDSSQLAAQLREIFAPRPRKVLFVQGDGAVEYERVVNAVDVARGAGIDVVGLVPRDDSATVAPSSKKAR